MQLFDMFEEFGKFMDFFVLIGAWSELLKYYFFCTTGLLLYFSIFKHTHGSNISITKHIESLYSPMNTLLASYENLQNCRFK
jgi:hypothetical protein